MNFLELEIAAGREQKLSFKGGKTYRDYFSKDQQKAISKLLRKVAVPQTLDLISKYLTDEEAVVVV